MGFFDNLKDTIQDRLHPEPARDDYYDDGYDDGYGDSYYGDAGVSEARGRSQRGADERQGSGLLGNPTRPEADSVSVYTRSGRHLSDDDLGSQPATDAAYQGDVSYRDSYRSDDWRSDVPTPVDDYEPAPAPAPRPAHEETAYVPPMTQPGVFGATGGTPGDVGLTAVPRVSSGKLPPYVLKPTSYDDVQMVIRRVRTNQPVVLSFKALKIETAKRVLDFCFGLACGIDGSVEELGDRVFVVLPQGISLSESDLAKLRSDGLVR